MNSKFAKHTSKFSKQVYHSKFPFLELMTLSNLMNFMKMLLVNTK